MSKEGFDQRAKTYDTGEKIRRAQSLAASVLKTMQGVPQPPAAVLDFGCGTGMLTFELAPHVSRIDGYDQSSGMGKQFADKIRAGGFNHVRLLPDWSAVEAAAADPYDCVVSSLVFHHLSDVTGTAARLCGCLKPGGQLILIELDTDDGHFHAHVPDYDGYNGFDRGDLAAMLQAAGFGRVHTETCYTGDKTHAGITKPYSMFLLSAVKI